MLNVRTPVRRIDDAFIGGLVAAVAVGDLSYLIGDRTQGGDGRYFILPESTRHKPKVIRWRTATLCY